MIKNNFQPDYNNLLAVLQNQKPKRLPLYEHIIDVPFVSMALGKELIPQGNSPNEMEAYYSELIVNNHKILVK